MTDDLYRLRGPRGIEYQRARDALGAVYTDWERKPASQRSPERFAEAAMLRLAQLEPPMTVVSLEPPEGRP